MCVPYLIDQYHLENKADTMITKTSFKVEVGAKVNTASMKTIWK
jgi:hypothetical protein